MIYRLLIHIKCCLLLILYTGSILMIIYSLLLILKYSLFINNYRQSVS
uniref:Uncharacterized protein n=1 Tax=Anguilla anguilla TaxID=7936 RepID=A0A0E9WGC2_ANGAN